MISRTRPSAIERAATPDPTGLRYLEVDNLSEVFLLAFLMDRTVEKACIRAMKPNTTIPRIASCSMFTSRLLDIDDTTPQHHGLVAGRIHHGRTGRPGHGSRNDEIDFHV